MNNQGTNFTLQGQLSSSLESISGIKFTPREIDVIACILNRLTAKKIASFLSISHKTVENHIHNIMGKLECNSRESIIDFIENAAESTVLRRHYTSLSLQAHYEIKLREIARLRDKNKESCLIIYSPGDKRHATVVHQLTKDLKLAGITWTIENQNELASVEAIIKDVEMRQECFLLYAIPYGDKSINKEVISDSLHAIGEEEQITSDVKFLLYEKNNKIKKFINFALMDERNLNAQLQYYISVFEIIKNLFAFIDTEEIISKLQKKIEGYQVIGHIPHSQEAINKDQPNTLKNYFLAKRNSFPTLQKNILGIIIILLISLPFFAFMHFSKDNKVLLLQEETPSVEKIRSDLIIPTSDILLDRSLLMNKIRSHFKQRPGIQAVALVGMGGAGKTTLARQFAHEQKAKIVWEINAETRDSLMSSFESLAESLSKKDEDIRILNEIVKIKKPDQKQKQIIKFVKEHLRQHPNWFLLFDNVEKFETVLNFFPHDTDTWGDGKIIITTRDSNIQNNEYINNVIYLPELEASQKLTLFVNVMNFGRTHRLTPLQIKEAEKFLQKLPPFPLDISIAAYYIKATNIPYATYIENINSHSQDFTKIQENLLKESGEYRNTRYGIIALSLKQLMSIQEEFKDLLLFISLLDSQNIPIELLYKCKNHLIIENFIYHLKKYSLILNDTSSTADDISIITLHRSTHEITLAYLSDTLNLRSAKDLIIKIADILNDYLDEVIRSEDLVKMKDVVSSCEVFLSHKELINNTMEGKIKGGLGVINYYYGDALKAKALLEESLSKLENSNNDNPTLTAFLVGYLGNVYRELGDYEKAKHLLKQSVTVYTKYPSKDPLRYGYFLVYLGIIERYTGHYTAAKDLFEQALVAHKKYFPENENFLAWVLQQKGIVNKQLGNYEIAQRLLEESLTKFKKRKFLIFDVACSLENLGAVYIQMEDYEKAKNLLEESLKMYAPYIPEKLGAKWVLSHLKSENNLSKPSHIEGSFDQVNKIYNKHFHENYIYVAYPLRQLGILYGKQKDFSTAKYYLKESLSIYQKNYGDNHLETARTLADLGEVHSIEGQVDIAENLLKRAVHILERNNHPERYHVLEKLGNLYIKKSIEAGQSGEKIAANNYKTQGIQYLNNSLEIIKIHFSKDSPHAERILKLWQEITGNL